MSEEHLKALRNILDKNQWVINAESSGNEYDISAVWGISRPDGKSKLHIEFSGLDDMNTLPIEQSYGCKIREYQNIELYFARINRSWDEALSEFIANLNEIDS